MLTKLKRKAQSWLKNEAELAHRMGLTANHVSAAGFLLALLSAVSYATWHGYRPFSLVLAAALLLLSGFCDALDGALARVYGAATRFGGFLDSLMDRYADALVLCGIIYGGLCDLLWGLLALIGSLLVSYARARAEAAGVGMESVGLAERPERILILVFSTLAATFWLNAVYWAVILLAFLTNLTVLQRGLYFHKGTWKKESG